MPIRLGSLVAIVALVACGKESAPQAPARAEHAARVVLEPDVLARLGVRVEPAGTGLDEHRLRLPATLDYDLERYAEVGAVVEGRVASVRARVGDRVKKGDPLATLRVPTLAEAQASYARAFADFTVAERHNLRERAMLDDRATSVRSAEVAEGDALRARAALAAARAKLEVLGLPIPRDPSAAEAAGLLTLRAPIDGLVVRRDAVPGRFLGPDDTAFVVADTRSLWASVDVFEADMPYLAAGLEVTLVTEAAPGRVFRGHIAAIEPQVARDSRSMRARVVVDNADGALRPGLFLWASIPLPAVAPDGRPVVPSSAVQPLGDREVVFVERARGEFEVREVRVSQRTAQVAVLEGGLAKGEPIAAKGAFVLRTEVTRQ